MAETIADLKAKLAAQDEQLKDAEQTFTVLVEKGVTGAVLFHNLIEALFPQSEEEEISEEETANRLLAAHEVADWWLDYADQLGALIVQQAFDQAVSTEVADQQDNS
jgi:hypothetical protein